MARMVDVDELMHVTDIEGNYLKTGWVPATVFGVPVVEAEPVRHANWIVGRNCVVCSGCGAVISFSPILTPYCPYCGARMNEVKND